MTNGHRTAALMAALITLFAFLGQVLGGQPGLIFAFGLAVVLAAVSYWFSDKIVLRMYRGRRVGPDDAPELYWMVNRLRQRAGLPMPKVYVIPIPEPNAFATGRNPAHAAVAFTEGILRALPMDELEGVTAHELAHIKHRDILTATIAAIFASGVMILVRVTILNGRSALLALPVLILAPLVAILIEMAISRSREYEADRRGAEISGNPDGLANALLRMEIVAEEIQTEAHWSTAHMFIVSPFAETMDEIASLFSTHPPTEERVARLRAMAAGVTVRQGRASRYAGYTASGRRLAPLRCARRPERRGGSSSRLRA